MPLYSSGNGKVDGYEFILTFYHLRFKNRDSHRRLKTSKSAKEYFFTDAGHRNSYRQERLISCNQEEVFQYMLYVKSDDVLLIPTYSVSVVV
jgi:hypothetical protein